MRNAKIGSVSHGTLRTADLLYNFGVDLDYLNENSAAMDRVYAVFGEDSTEIADGKDDEASALLDALREELEEKAPAYCYFGAHEGDGSDFGFWPSMDSVEDLPKYNDLADVPDDIGEDYVVVNDHGNVSVYGADGVLIWDCV